MPSDFPALDLPDDVHRVLYIYIFFLSELLSVIFLLPMHAISVSHRVPHALTRDAEGRHGANREAGHQLNGACLSYECQLGPLSECQYSMLMQGCGFPQTDVIVPCLSPCLLVLLSAAETMPACTSTVA